MVGCDEHLPMLLLGLRNRLGEICDGLLQVVSLVPSSSTIGSSKRRNQDTTSNSKKARKRSKETAMCRAGSLFGTRC
jgi:hypothetical protein